MTIAAFCRKQLLAHDRSQAPLTLDELADRASRAGVTRAATPRSSVRSAMRGRELELSGERWVTPLWLLEGRCLTTPALGLPDWTCDPRDTSEQDLGLLHLAANLAPIPLVGGGHLAKKRWYGGWKCSVPLPEPQPHELLCFRVTGGALEVTTVPTASTLTPAAGEFVKELNRDVPMSAYQRWSASWEPDGTAVLRRLAELLMADDGLLRTPAPPLSECSELLADEVRRLEQRRHESNYLQRYESYYSEHDDIRGRFIPPGMVELTLTLSPEDVRVIEPLAMRAGLTLEEWFGRVISGAKSGPTPPPPLRLERTSKRKGIAITGQEIADMIREDRDSH